jgi:predicted RNA-binding protein with EMAP domain
MSQSISTASLLANSVVLADLSRDLLKVASRIQAEMQHVSFSAIKPTSLFQVEAAEQAVDSLAQDLSRGEGELAAWHQALTAYETAWFQVIASLGERKN